jgi:phage gpG-like protein
VSGDFSALRSLIDRVGGGGVQELLPRVAQRMAETAVKLLGDEFHQSRDPYGNPWEPLRVRQGKPLVDTGRMMRSRTAQANGPTILVTIGTNYAAYHQYGTGGRRTGGARKGRKGRARGPGGIPRRQMLPEAETGGLGSIWTEAFNKDADDVVRKALGG